MNGLVNNRFAQAAGCLSPPLYCVLKPYFSKFENSAQEIRLRINRPLSIVCMKQTYYYTESGGLTDLPCGDTLTVERADIDNTFQKLCEYSVYARQKEIVNGFVTFRGGHRAGICGSAVLSDGKVSNVTDITSINIRIAREHRGCAEGIFPEIAKSSGGVLLCGEPCSGKTTMLRDLARLFSVREGAAVSLIDERGELAACAMGEPQNDVGLCDVFDGYPRAEAMSCALRCMSPQIIICDEIGGDADAAAVEQCAGSGVRLIATAHARDRTELFQRKSLRSILSSGAFSTLIFLAGRSRAGVAAITVKLGDSLAA